MIRHLKHADIDKRWWNARLVASTGRSWYALAEVLDAASPGWEALVDEGTESVMPLTSARKFGFHYLYQPFAIQRLGVFSAAPSSALCGAMLNAVPKHFMLWDIRLNLPECIGGPGDVHYRQMTNMIVDLEGDIDGVRGQYGESHRRGLRKWSGEAGPEPMDGEAFIRFILGSEQIRTWGVGRKEEQVFKRLIRATSKRGEGYAMGIRHHGEWAAAGYFVEYERRTIFLKGLSTQEGRKVFAMHRLIDAMIEKSIGRSDEFDLAGGEDQALRRFYGGFGARPELYLRARVNRLPQPLRWVKQRSDGA